MGHDHRHAPPDRIGVAFLLNVGFTLIELVGAWATNSTAIAADALHDLGDSLALGFAWVLQRLSERPPTRTFTYSFKRLSLLAALVNALILVAGGALVLWESVPRLLDPVPPHVEGMIGLAVLGVVVNGLAVLRLRSGTSLNEQVVSWHLLEDVLGWVVVLIGAVVMRLVDAPILDPLLSIGLTVWISWNALKSLHRTGRLFLQAAPDVSLDDLQQLVVRPGVRGLEDVQLWSLDGETHVLTGRLLVGGLSLEEAVHLRNDVRHDLEHHHILATLELAIDGDVPRTSCTAHPS